MNIRSFVFCSILSERGSSPISLYVMSLNVYTRVLDRFFSCEWSPKSKVNKNQKYLTCIRMELIYVYTLEALQVVITLELGFKNKITKDPWFTLESNKKCIFGKLSLEPLDSSSIPLAVDTLAVCSQNMLSYFIMLVLSDCILSNYVSTFDSIILVCMNINITWIKKIGLVETSPRYSF